MHVWLDHDNYSHRFYLNDTLTESQAAGHTIDYIYEKDVDAIFGSPKSLCMLLFLFTHTNSFFWTWYYSYCFFSVKCSVTPIERTSLPGFMRHLFIRTSLPRMSMWVLYVGPSACLIVCVQVCPFVYVSVLKCAFH